MTSTSGLDDLMDALDDVSGIMGGNHDPACMLEVGLPSWLEELGRRLLSSGDISLGDALSFANLWMKNTIKHAHLFGGKIIIILNFPIAFKCKKRKALPYDVVPCSGTCKPEETQFDVKLTIPVNTVGTDAWKDGVKDCMERYILDIDQFRCLRDLIEDIGLMGWGHIDMDDLDSMTQDELVEFLTPVMEELFKWMEEQFYPKLWEAIAAASKINCKCEEGDRGGSSSNDFMFSLYSPQMKNKLGKGMGLMDGKTVLVPSTMQAQFDRIAKRRGAYPNLSGVRDLLTGKRIS